jgi:gentisate 1,2-dioxygenase
MAEPHATSDEMETFYRTIAAKSMDALWHRTQGGAPRGPDPVAPYDPMHWSGQDIATYIKRAGELVRPGPDAQRRVLVLANASAGPFRSATHTLYGNVQMVLPGEIAPTHRHTSSAIRFIMEGEGAVTIVDGEPVEMAPGDLVLTPGWCFHGHVSKADGPVLWMDSLDSPLIGALRIGRAEQYPDELEPATVPVGASYNRYGGGNLRPLWQRQSSRISPQLLYPWAKTEQALHELKRTEASPFDDVAFEYTNPTTGGPVLPTLGCNIQLIRPGVSTKAHRHSSSTVYYVFRGSGYSVIDGVRIDWAAGDFISLPPWAWHEHANPGAEDAVLFSTTDAPMLEALVLLEEHEHPGNGHQEVTSTYAERYGNIPVAQGS